MIHKLAEVHTEKIGDGTDIWQFVVILQGARIGRNCNISAHCFIENNVVIGDNVTIKGGVQLWDGLRIGDGVFVGPNVTFTNDKFPRSKRRPEEYPVTEIHPGASIGANATIFPGITVGKNAMVSAGAVVTHNVPAHAIVLGNPARIVGYADADIVRADHREAAVAEPKKESLVQLGIGAACLYRLPIFSDIRGSLAVGEFEKILPFAPKRFFFVFDVPSKEVRGEHAHKKCKQFLICVAGSCSVVLDNGVKRRELLFDRPNIGLYIPAMVWATQYKYTSDAVLLIFASDLYNPDDYIRDYGQYIEMVGTNPG